MDAASAASALVGLLFNCATAVQQCNNLQGKYKHADQTLRSIATQGLTLRTSIHQLQHLMLRDPATLSSRWDIESMLPQTFETAIDTFNAVLLALLQELEKFHGKVGLSSGSPLTRGLKIKLLWNESAMQDILVRLRDQQRSLHFLLTILQMETISDMRNGIHENQELLKKIVQPMRKLGRPPPDQLKRKTHSVEEGETSLKSQDKDGGDDDTNSENYEGEEPPAKRRSLSPEEESINPSLSPPRTRSGKIYHPSNCTGVSSLTAFNLAEAANGAFEFTAGLPPSKGKQLQNTASRSGPRSRYQKQERKQNNGRYSLGRSLSPASSTLSSPVAQSPSITHVESNPKGRLASPTSSRTHDPQTTHHITAPSGKQRRSPNLVIGSKQANLDPSHSRARLSHTKFVNNLKANSVLPNLRNGGHKIRVDSNIAMDDPSSASRKLNVSNPSNYRSPQVGSDLEDDFIKSLSEKASIIIQDYPSPSNSIEEVPPISKATEASARKHHIPRGYSLKNWDPSEEPILLLGSVFDMKSLGKWIYEWAVYQNGLASPISSKASELQLNINQLAEKTKRGEKCMPRIRLQENRELVEDFIESAERLNLRLKGILEVCELSMLETSRQTEKPQSHKNKGLAFVDSMFGKDQQLDTTERFMASTRLWILRFNANCEEILQNPTQ